MVMVARFTPSLYALNAKLVKCLRCIVRPTWAEGARRRGGGSLDSMRIHGGDLELNINVA